MYNFLKNLCIGDSVVLAKNYNYLPIEYFSGQVTRVSFNSIVVNKRYKFNKKTGKCISDGTVSVFEATSKNLQKITDSVRREELMASIDDILSSANNEKLLSVLEYLNNLNIIEQ